MSHNVPDVYDVLAARVKALRAKIRAAKCGGGFAWELSVA
jgi:hypothetical protein